MRLNVDLGPLWKQVRRISDRGSNFALEALVRPFDEIDATLSSQGIEVRLDDLESTGGLLSYHGRQVLLYIPDQAWAIRDVLDNPSQGKKFHVSHCRTLQNMKDQGRFERYVATNDLSGTFRISGTDNVTREEVEGEAALNVCKNCLHKLNYEQYRENPNAAARDKAVASFSISTFFETYSTIFPHMPKQLNQAAKHKGYTEDWKEVSARLRAKRDFICDDCSVNLQDHKRLLHVHHVNGVRSDNTPSNLRVLCAACHKNQPMHDHIYLKKEDMQLIQRVRRLQQITSDNWREVFEYADTSIHGVLGILKQNGLPAPEIGLEITSSSGRVVAEVEAGWRRLKQALVLTEEDRLEIKGWKIFTLEELTSEPGLLSPH